MPYATAEQMIAAVGADRLIRTFPDLGETPLTTALDEMLLVGASKIDSYIGHVYSTPIDTDDITDASQKTAADAHLKRVNIALAIEALFLGLDKIPDAWKQSIAAANSWLEAIRDRRLRISGLSSFGLPIVRAYGDCEEEAPNTLTDEIFIAWQFL